MARWWPFGRRDADKVVVPVRDDRGWRTVLTEGKAGTERDLSDWRALVREASAA